MRITINLPEALGQAAKERAAAERRTFTSLVEEGLRLVLAPPDAASPVDEQPLPAYGDPDGRFLIDIEDREALYAVLDAEGPR
ncbi:MAG: CopG family transcriptional regulator [Acidimicrobiia bacterium]|nr:CopG family transcriptional regulator [Acidimicrobiia bacterium]